jgi:hypothetical protein
MIVRNLESWFQGQDLKGVPLENWLQVLENDGPIRQDRDPIIQQEGVTSDSRGPTTGFIRIHTAGPIDDKYEDDDIIIGRGNNRVSGVITVISGCTDSTCRDTLPVDESTVSSRGVGSFPTGSSRTVIDPIDSQDFKIEM